MHKDLSGQNNRESQYLRGVLERYKKTTIRKNI